MKKYIKPDSKVIYMEPLSMLTESSLEVEINDDYVWDNSGSCEAD